MTKKERIQALKKSYESSIVNRLLKLDVDIKGFTYLPFNNEEHEKIIQRELTKVDTLNDVLKILNDKK